MERDGHADRAGIVKAGRHSGREVVVCKGNHCPGPNESRAGTGAYRTTEGMNGMWPINRKIGTRSAVTSSSLFCDAFDLVFRELFKNFFERY